jgi:hypothetical protein
MRLDGRWGAGAALVGAAIYNLPNLLYPLFEDSGLFALIGYWMSHGATLYRDILDQKPPLGYLILELGVSLFGTHSAPLRVFELLFVLLTAGAVGSIASTSGIPRARQAATLTTGAALSCLLLRLPERGQMEIYQAAATALGLALLPRAAPTATRRDDWRVAASGAALAAASWIKPQGALLATSLGLALAAWRLRESRRASLRFLAWFVGGGVTLSALLVAWLAWRGVLGDFYVMMFRLNPEYLKQQSTVSLFASLAFSAPYGLPTLVWALVAASVPAAIVLVRRRAPQLAVILALWTISGYLQFYSGHYLFNYHKVIYLPAVAGCLGIVIAAALQPVEQRAPWLKRLAGWLAAAALMISPWLAATYRQDWESLLRCALTDRSLVHEQTQRGVEAHYYDWTAQVILGRRIADQTSPQDTVQVLGRASVLYLVAKRRPSSRLVVTSAAFDPRRASRQALRHLLVSDMDRTRPKFVIMRTRDAFPWFGLPPTSELVSQDPEFVAWLTDRYEPQELYAGDFLIFRRKEAEPQ